MQQTGERNPGKPHATFEAGGGWKGDDGYRTIRADEDRVIDRTATVTVSCIYSAMSELPSTRRSSVFDTGTGEPSWD
jgi:hypothetical protein